MTPLERAARALEDVLRHEVSNLPAEVYQDAARRVLTAICEPSEAMENAGGDRDALGYDPAPGAVWRAMIDAALAE